MALITGVLNGTNINNDYQFSLAARALLNSGVISGFAVTSGSVSAGEALIEVTRANGQKVLVAVTDLSAFTLDTSGTKKVWIAISQTKVDDGSFNATDGSGIATITTGPSYPVSGSFIKLASISAGAITDDRVTITGKALARSGMTAKAFVATDANGKEVFLPGVAGQTLGFDSSNIPVVQNPAAVEADGETVAAVAGEAITAGDGLGAVFFGQGTTKTYLLSQTTSNTDISIGQADANTRFAFYFTPPTTEKIGATFSFGFLLKKVGAPTDNLEFRLLDSTKTAVSGWTTATIAGTALTTAYVLNTITQSVAITGGQKYYLDLRRSGANDGTNYYQIQTNNANVNTGYGYATYTASTTTWSTDNENDPYFAVQYWAIFTIGKIYHSDSRYIDTAFVDGIAIISGAVNAVVKVKTDWVFLNNGVVPWTKYYLNNNWAFGITPPTNVFQIGRGLTSTAISLTLKETKAIKDIPSVLSVIQGTQTYISATRRSTSSSTPVKLKEIIVKFTGIVDVTWNGANANQNSYLYKNGVQIAWPFFMNDGSAVTATVNGVSVVPWDALQVYVAFISFGANAGDFTIKYQDTSYFLSTPWF